MPFVPPNSTTFEAIVTTKQSEGLSAAKAPLRIPRPTYVEEPVETRLHGPEVLRPGQRVLGEIDASALGDDAFIHLVDQCLCVVTHGEIERDGGAGLRKGGTPRPLRRSPPESRTGRRRRRRA